MGTRGAKDPLQPQQADRIGSDRHLRWVPLPVDVRQYVDGVDDTRLVLLQLEVISELLSIQIHEARMMHEERMKDG